MTQRQVTVVGGSGFIGRYVVQRLAARGDLVRVAVRHPNQALFLKPLGDVGQVTIVPANLTKPDSLSRSVAGSDAVVNLVGLLSESGSQTFNAVQATGAGALAEAAAKAGVKHFVQLSAIGADADSPARYGRSKFAGEQAVLAAFPGATILRPSLVIGAEDGFFNRFAKMMKLMPVLALPGLETRFQPVCVNDVADAVLTALDGSADTASKVFELGGPEVMTMRALLTLLMDYTETRRPLVSLPGPLATSMALFTGLLPNPPLTLDQLALLKADNVVSDGALTLADMGLAAHPFEEQLARYAVQYRPHGQFS